MADSNISTYENSTQDGQPIECYKFTHMGTNYLYTSHVRDVEIIFMDNGVRRTEKYFADHIERKNIKPGSSGDSVSTTVEVHKDHVIAKLWQGPPPEKPVMLTIYRLHEQDHGKVDVVFYGRVGQTEFSESACTLTAKLEDWLSKEVPNGMRQFVCNNMIYDTKCKLKEADWAVPAFVDRVEGLNVYSSTFAAYPDGYFVGGFLRFDGSIRQIIEHKGNRIRAKYPFINPPRNDIVVAPGCDQLFKTCALKFHNTLNYTGCLYVPPADPEHAATGRGVYWVDSQVIQRDTNGFVGTISM